MLPTISSAVLQALVCSDGARFRFLSLREAVYVLRPNRRPTSDPMADIGLPEMLSGL